MIPEWLINIWIAVMLLIILGWDQPVDAPIRWLIRPLLPSVKWLGLWHGWKMFAPNVSKSTKRAVVIVMFADGGSATWSPPGGSPTTAWNAFRHLRWRKTMELSQQRDFRHLRPCLCRFVLDQVLANLQTTEVVRVPVEVHLVQISEPILWPHETNRSKTETRTVLHRMRVERLPSPTPEVK